MINKQNKRKTSTKTLQADMPKTISLALSDEDKDVWDIISARRGRGWSLNLTLKTLIREAVK